jgi:hypothetical protein
MREGAKRRGVKVNEDKVENNAGLYSDFELNRLEMQLDSLRRKVLRIVEVLFSFAT